MNTLQKFNMFKVNLMHILFIGPLIFYIGKGKQNNPELVYHMILTLTIMLPFIVRFPSLEFKHSKDYNQITHLVIFTILGYYIYKEGNNLPVVVFDILKFSDLGVTAIHSYLLVEKKKKYA